METKTEITSFQFYTILFLSRVFTLVTYISNTGAELSSDEMLWASVMTGLFLLITSLPTVWLIQKDAASSILTRASCLSPVFAKIIAVVYLFDFLLYGSITAARFEIFASSVMFPESDISFIVITLLAATAYSAHKGIEALGRSGVIFLIPVLLIFAFVFLSLFKHFDTLNFTPMMTNNYRDMLTTGLYGCSRTGSLLSVALLLPHIKNAKKRSLPIWVFLMTLTIFTTTLMLTGILGSFNKTQLFSMYSLSVLAKFGFVERMDALITCIWMVCAGVELSFFLYLCDQLCSFLFQKERKAVYLILSAVLIFAGMYSLSDSIMTFSKLIASPFTAIVYGFTSCLIPLSVIFAEKIKEKKQNETI